MNVGEMVTFLRRVDPSTPVEQIIAIRCGKCGDKKVRGARAGDSIEMKGLMSYGNHPPRPAAKGSAHHAEAQPIEGVSANGDVRSWCHHTDSDVTIEVLQTITVPIEIMIELHAAGPDSQESASIIFEKLGPLIFQTMSCVGFHAAEVEMCRKNGGDCPHKAEA